MTKDELIARINSQHCQSRLLTKALIENLRDLGTALGDFLVDVDAEDDDGHIIQQLFGISDELMWTLMDFSLLSDVQAAKTSPTEDVPLADLLPILGHLSAMEVEAG